MSLTGVHSGRKFEDVYLDHESYVKWVLHFLVWLTDLERTLKRRGEQDKKVREARLEMSGSLVEEMASEGKNVVEEFKRAADLEEEEQDWRCEQTAEREGAESKSEAAETSTETQAAEDRQENRGEEKERQTVDVNLTPDSERRRKMWEYRWKQGGDGTGQQQPEDGQRVADDDDGDERQQGGQQQQGNWRQVDKRGGKQSLEELVRIVKFRMRQEERQEQMSGGEEAIRESELHREKRWEIGKGKGTRRGEVTGGERKVEEQSDRKEKEEGEKLGGPVARQGRRMDECRMEGGGGVKW